MGNLHEWLKTIHPWIIGRLKITKSTSCFFWCVAFVDVAAQHPFGQEKREHLSPLYSARQLQAQLRRFPITSLVDDWPHWTSTMLRSSFGGWVEALLEMSSCKNISTKWSLLIGYNWYMHVELAWKLNGVIFQVEVQIKLWPKTPRYQLPKSKTLKLHKGPGQRYIDNHRNYSQCKRHLGKCCQNTLYSSNIDHLLRKVHCLLPILYSNFCRLQNGTSKTTQSDSINPRISGEKNSHDCKYKRFRRITSRHISVINKIRATFDLN